ncbi:DUF4153 domain-containing protein [Phocaeicola sp.]|uniref:DUF4153 domain-containing protein n=1 Tax=Phocaeicola sp. TaxID=2773926 RepID=UPI00307800A5
MLGHWFQKIIQTFNGTLQSNLKRFPITLFFTIALTCYLCYFVSNHDENKKLNWIIGYYLSVGTLLSLTLHLWCEEMKRIIPKIAVQAGMHLLLILDAIYLYSYSYEKSFTEIGIAHGAGILAIGLSVFFLSFFKEKNDIPSWNFALSSITACMTANVIGCIMSGGICFLILSVHKLFDLSIDSTCYLYVAILCNVCLSMFLFLGLLPQKQEKHNTRPLQHSFLNGVIHYLFLPLTGGYLIVLYIYALRILINWELPIGWVSWLVITLMTGCIVIEFGLYPSRMAQQKRTDNLIARWLPLFVLPLLLLMTIGIIRRFNDYGVTINRLYLITLNIWCYFVCIILIIIKAKRISWIPISFSLVFLLTSVLPVNYASITRQIIQKEVNQTIIRQKPMLNLPLSQEQYNQWLKTFSPEQARQINEKFIYLYEWFGKESICQWIDEDVSLYMLRTEFEDKQENQSTVSYSGTIASEATISVPDGYQKLQSIHRYQIIDHKGQDKIIAVSLTQDNDTVYIDQQTIESLSQRKKGEMPPTQLNCNSSQKAFLLTSFSIEKTEENIEVSIDGYLFSK